MFLSGSVAMILHTRHIESRADRAAIRTETRRLEHEMASLNERLTGLWDVLVEARTLVNHATGSNEGLGGPWIALTRQSDDEDLDYSDPCAASAVRLDETLRQAREVAQCYEEVLSRMEGNADLMRGIPSIQPVTNASLSSGFGLRTDPFTRRLGWHQGLDFSVPYGTPVRATAAGLVVRAGWFGSYGRLVEIDHGNGLVTRYAHLSRVTVHTGQRIDREDEVGRVGSTGRSNAPHLHYEVHLYGQAVNPEPYIVNDFALMASGSSGSSSAPSHLE